MLLALTGVPALLQLLSLPFFPESPRYTLIQGRDEDTARKGTGDTGLLRHDPLPRLPKGPKAENGQVTGSGEALGDAGTNGEGQGWVGAGRPRAALGCGAAETAAKVRVDVMADRR